MRLEALDHPLVQVLDVGDRVHLPAGRERVGVLGVEGRGDDARLVLAGFEVRVREAEEDFLQLVFVEEVGEEFHRVGPDAGYVLVVCSWGDGEGVCFVTWFVGGGFLLLELGLALFLLLLLLLLELGLGSEGAGFFLHVFCHGHADLHSEE